MADSNTGYGKSYDLFEQQDMAAVRRAFGPDMGAEVPAVRISSAQWQDIRFIVRELASLSDGWKEVDLSGTLIQGAALQEAVIRARSLLGLVEGEL